MSEENRNVQGFLKNCLELGTRTYLEITKMVVGISKFDGRHAKTRGNVKIAEEDSIIIMVCLIGLILSVASFLFTTNTFFI